MLTELTTVPTPALPLQEFKDHLRLGTGFANDGVQDVLAEGYLRSAIAAIEGRIGKALITRDFQLRLEGWRDGRSQALPVAPVAAIVSVTVTAADGTPTVLLPSTYRLVPDMHRPRLTGAGLCLPSIPTDGHVDVVFTAGFAAAWVGVPVDLAQATLLLAAQFHENRHEGREQGAVLPFGVMALIERWRTVRVLGGGEA